MKTLITFGLAMLPFVSSAQFERGQVYLGGSLSGSLVTTASPISPTNSNSKSIDNQLSVSPYIGFFLNSKFVMGSAMGILPHLCHLMFLLIKQERIKPEQIIVIIFISVLSLGITFQLPVRSL
jgi:hypothetical protein